MPKSKAHLNRQPWLVRLVLDITEDLVSTYTVQRRDSEDAEWEVALIPSNLTPAVYLYREAAEDHAEALRGK